MLEQIRNRRRVFVSVTRLARDLSPVAEHVLGVIEHSHQNVPRFVLDPGTIQLLASQNGMNYETMCAVIDEIEQSGALRFIGLDGVRGGL